MGITKSRKKLAIMRVICRKCGAEFDINVEKLEKESEGGDSIQDQYSYTCPCCYRSQYIGKHQLSEDILLDMQHMNCE